MHYLDYAATSALRPTGVAQAVFEFLSGVGASPGRGGYLPSIEAGRTAFRCRRRLASLLGLPGDPGRVAFTSNATEALNIALLGTLGPGDVVVTTAYDHNAVLRPVHFLSQSRGVVQRCVAGAPDGSIDFDELDRALDGARLLVVNEVSNVLGTRLPLERMASRAHDAGALVLVDTAQSAGHIPTHPATAGADIVAMTGHKGLLGPQGIGALWIRPDLEISPLLRGGTGGDSATREMPESLPDRFEAGTPNIPGIVGLLAGLQYLEAEGIDTIHARQVELASELRAGIGSVPGVQLCSPADPSGDGTAIVTFTATSIDPATLGRRLEEEWGVLCRTGIHCAPEVHRMLGTLDTGAVRLSLGWASTREDVDRAIAGVTAIAGPVRISVPDVRAGGSS